MHGYLRHRTAYAVVQHYLVPEAVGPDKEVALGNFANSILSMDSVTPLYGSSPEEFAQSLTEWFGVEPSRYEVEDIEAGEMQDLFIIPDEAYEKWHNAFVHAKPIKRPRDRIGCVLFGVVVVIGFLLTMGAICLLLHFTPNVPGG